MNLYNKFSFVICGSSLRQGASKPDWDGTKQRSGGGREQEAASVLMRYGFKMTLDTWNPALRTLYITALVILWVGATIANIATIFGLSVDFIGLIGISVFIGAELVRSYKGSVNA